MKWPVFWRCLGEGTLYSLALIWCAFMVAWVCGGFSPGWSRPETPDGYLARLFAVDFARKIDGTCSGWTRGQAIIHAIGDLLHFWAYLNVSLMMMRLHPKEKTVKYAKQAIWLSAAFIAGCGMVHLVDAFCVFVPVYRFLGMLKVINGGISVLALFPVAVSLIKVSTRQAKNKADNERIMKELIGLRRRDS